MTALVLRYRLWLIGALALVNGVVDTIGGPRSNDFFNFTDASRILFSSEWASAFDDPFFQVGPLALVWPALTEWLHEVTNVSHEAIFAVSVYLLFSLGIIFVLRALYRDREEETPPVVELGVGLGTMIIGFCWTGVESGQPFDAVVAVMWVLAARAALRDRPAAAGLILAGACFIKLVAALGIPLLLLVPAWRRRGTAVVWFGAAFVLGYLPFFLFGEVRMFDFEWEVFRDAPLALFVEPGSPFTWQMRAIQGAVVVGAGMGAVHVLRRSPEVVWVAPLTMTVLRLLTDPVTYQYYWLGAEAIGILGVGLLLPRVSVRARVALIVGIYVVGMALLLPGWWTSGLRYLLAGSLVLFALRRYGTHRGSVEEAAAPV